MKYLMHRTTWQVLSNGQCLKLNFVTTFPKENTCELQGYYTISEFNIETGGS